MNSSIAGKLRLRPLPLAMLFADEKPSGALEHDEEQFGCVISLLDAAMAGRVVVLGRESQECMLQGIGRCHQHVPTDNLPHYKVKHNYLVLKTLRRVDLRHETPEVVTMLVNVNQLTSLVVLANYVTGEVDSVMIPRAASCHAVFLLPYHEAQQGRQRAVVGMLDPLTREFVNENMLSFSVPWHLFVEMEKNVDKGVLDQPS
jgi:uncharacterized protein (DUF169 family)